MSSEVHICHIQYPAAGKEDPALQILRYYN